ncbi:hypothetical protein [Hymenobacter jejuensis]|uniref:Uncharacterized protein n=1 Tax=Hymenobacter jejuensis TaxID=2502781 RepID=A0A5B8A1D2_9BACT|nr:hypothetical protein [Hymenobacter jejuensis]QDA61191.1 hypothetical protein FHG12_14255 [Hymenobacter jejuensis]
MADHSENLNDHLYATNLGLGSILSNDTFAHDPTTFIATIDGWLPMLQNADNAKLKAAAADLQQLKEYMRNGDKTQTGEMLQRLGEQASREASHIHTWAGDHLHNGIGDQLRHLGQILIMASGNLKVS